MLQAVIPATVNQAPIGHAVQKPSALEQHYVPTGEPLVTPDHLDQVNKQRTAHVRQTLNGVKKRKKAVAATPADNGISALSAELQNEINIGMNPVIPTLPDIHQTSHHQCYHSAETAMSCRSFDTNDHNNNVGANWSSQNQMSGVCPWCFIGTEGDGTRPY
jgi:hypothetical protein